MALGIGANSAIFSVVSAVILRPLEYPSPERLVFISSQFPKQGFTQFWISPPEFLEFRERARSFSSVGAFVTSEANLTAPDRPLRVQSAFVSRDLFATLGVEPLVGRVFEAAEDLPSSPQVAVLSFELWQSAFGRAPVVGTEIEINNLRRTVVGIMPRGFDVADQHVQLWLPLGLDPANRQNRGSHFLYLIGRLAPASTLASARGELDTLLSLWPASIGGGPNSAGGPHTPDPVNHRLRFDPLQVQIVGSARTAVWVLQGAVVLVLLIACGNLANLLLARADSRRQEFAVRAALGASRTRLLAQLVMEGLVLSGAGAVLGIALAVIGLHLLIGSFPDSLPRAGAVSMNTDVLVFTTILALLTGVVFGFAPLLHLTSDRTLGALKDATLRSTASARRHLVRRVLVAMEVALAVALVIGAGLLLRTVMNLASVDAGFNRSRLVTFGLSLPSATYSKPEQVRAFYARLLADLSSAPGVQAVAAMTGLPPLRRVNANDTDIEGYVAPPDGPFANVDYYNTVTGYVETMGIPIVEGRAFLPTDAFGSTVIINEALARTFYKDRNPIGRRIRPSAPPSANVPWYTIIGVLKDVKQGGVDQKTGIELYFNLEQVRFAAGTMNVVIRTSQSAEALSGTIRAAVARFDRSLPVVRLRSMDDVFTSTIARPRLLASLLGGFGGLALLLAAIGTYGVLRYVVTERRREIGIRMALGADRAAVLHMILSQGVRLAIAGIVVGLGMAVAMNRVLISLLYGVKPSDPTTIIGVVGLILIVALVACYLPAHAATEVDPMVVLRDQ